MIAHRFLRWIESTPPERRAEAAGSLARAYLGPDLEDDIRGGMEAALTVVLDDPLAAVRTAIAEALADSVHAPRHLVHTLAADQPEIATIVLARSPVLDDAELVDIVAAESEDLQVAIAGRPRLSSVVSAALAEVGEEAACRRLLGNPGAAIARISLRRIAERFGDLPDIRDRLIDRPDLPADVHQMLIRQLSDALGNLIVVRSWVSESRAETLTRDACDKATVAIAAETDTDDRAALVEHLRVTGQLTTALLLKAVCAGNVGLFVTALSVLARVPERRVASLVRSGRMTALRAVYGKARLAAARFRGFRGGDRDIGPVARRRRGARPLSLRTGDGRGGAVALPRDQRRRGERTDDAAPPVRRRPGARGGTRLCPRGLGGIAAAHPIFRNFRRKSGTPLFLEQLQYRNCSDRMRSSKEWSGSNMIRLFARRSWATVTSTTDLNSV